MLWGEDHADREEAACGRHRTLEGTTEMSWGQTLRTRPLNCKRPSLDGEWDSERGRNLHEHRRCPCADRPVCFVLASVVLGTLAFVFTGSWPWIA